MKTLLTAMALLTGVTGALTVTAAAHADEGIITQRTVVHREGYRDGYYDGLRYVPRREFVRVKRTRCWWQDHRRICRTVWERRPAHWNHGYDHR